jgi:SSS family solute:Na+ symporter
MGLALVASRFGGVIGLLILWYGALVGPIAIPMLLGLLLPFGRSGPAAAIAGWMTGAVAFGALKVLPPERWLHSYHHYANAVMVGAPMLVSFLSYIGFGLFAPSRRPESQAFLQALHPEDAAPLLDSTSTTDITLRKASTS